MQKLNSIIVVLLVIFLTFFILGCKDTASEEEAVEIQEAQPEQVANESGEVVARHGAPDRLPGSLKFASVSLQASGIDFINGQQGNLESSDRQDGIESEDASAQQTTVQTTQTDQSTSSTDPKPEDQAPSTSEPASQPEEVEPPKPGTMEYILWQQGKGKQQTTEQTTTETTTIIIQDSEGGMQYQQETTVETKN